MNNEYYEKAKVFKAFCDENRIQILELLSSGEKCACKLLDALKITQPTLSHHMKILCDSGVVTGRKEGKWVHYSIDEKGAMYAQELLRELLTMKEHLQDFCKVEEQAEEFYKKENLTEEKGCCS